jgi:hypothetical protein
MTFLCIVSSVNEITLNIKKDIQYIDYVFIGDNNKR